MSLLSYIGVYYLFYCECPLGCEVGLTVFHDLFMKIVAFQDTMVHSIQSLQQFNKDNPCGKNQFEFICSRKRPEPYSEPSRTSKMELFTKIAVNYFCKKNSPQMFNWVLNTPPETSGKLLFIYQSVLSMSQALVIWNKCPFSSYLGKKNIWYTKDFCEVLESLRYREYTTSYWLSLSKKKKLMQTTEVFPRIIQVELLTALD